MYHIWNVLGRIVLELVVEHFFFIFNVFCWDMKRFCNLSYRRISGSGTRLQFLHHWRKSRVMYQYLAFFTPLVTVSAKFAPLKAFLVISENTIKRICLLRPSLPSHSRETTCDSCAIWTICPHVEPIMIPRRPHMASSSEKTFSEISDRMLLLMQWWEYEPAQVGVSCRSILIWRLSVGKH